MTINLCKKLFFFSVTNTLSVKGSTEVDILYFTTQGNGGVKVMSIVGKNQKQGSRNREGVRFCPKVLDV